MKISPKILRGDNFEKLSFFESATLEFFFCLFVWNLFRFFWLDPHENQSQKIRNRMDGAHL